MSALRACYAQVLNIDYGDRPFSLLASRLSARNSHLATRNSKANLLEYVIYSRSAILLFGIRRLR